MNKQYQVYGIGNALVDFEIEATVEELAALSVEKGVMTLVDDQRQQALMHAFSGKHHSRACGGSAANTIIGAQTLGADCFYSCKVANDETGQFYRQDLLGHGVDSNLQAESLQPGDTGKCLVLITADADRSMNTFLGITGSIEYSQVDENALRQSQYLYIEGYLSSSPVACETAVSAMQFARANQVKTAFSLSDPNMVKFCREGLEAIIGDGVDLLFSNYDEATLFTGTDSLEAAAKALAPLAKVIVITLGSDGAVIIANGETSKVDAFPVKAIDTNGAGDLFAGSFLSALTQGHSLQNAGRLASFASAELVCQYGPRLKPAALEKVKAFFAQLV